MTVENAGHQRGTRKRVGVNTNLRIGKVIRLRVCALELSISRIWARLDMNGSRLWRRLGWVLEGWVNLWIIGAWGTLHA